MSAPMPPPPPPMNNLKLGAPAIGNNCKFLRRREKRQQKRKTFEQKSMIVYDLPQENHPTQWIQGQLSCRAFKKERN